MRRCMMIACIAGLAFSRTANAQVVLMFGQGDEAIFSNVFVSSLNREETQVEFILRSMSYPFSLGGLHFDPSTLRIGDGFFGTVTLQGGATIVGSPNTNAGRFGEFDIFGPAPETTTGGITTDVFDPPVVGCDVQPFAVLPDGPLFGGGFGSFGYYDTCVSGSYADVILDIPLVDSVDGAVAYTGQLPDLSTLPEPSSFALMVTGLIGLGGVIRRTRRSRQ